MRRGPFDVWAPIPRRVRLVTRRDHPEVVELSRSLDGWWRSQRDASDSEVDYGYLLDDDPVPQPDPRSRRQPHGVHELSRTWQADAFDWTDQRWTGRRLAGSMIYELHVGTFTPLGTLDSAIERLDHLVLLGVDFVEVMPVNAFNGAYNWGYDGVLWFSVDETYGGPTAYQRFVDACHARGLAVVQDVVYNHLGPSGNYLPRFGPYLSSAGASTWGPHVNLDGDGSTEVRRYILDNATMWFTDFHVDGLRLDAVHALHDRSPTHILEEMTAETATLSARLGRPLTLVAESDLNDPRLITPREAGGLGLDAQWSDDFHHAVHVALTGETDGYYADFAPLGALAKVCERGFFHDGSWSSFRGREHGFPIDTATMPTWRLVVSSQNHDQIGNRARGDRITGSLDEDQLGCAALLTLCGPFTPMLFQGEEWAASTPFRFFTAHPEEELGRAIAEGRLAEFEAMGWDPSVVPDPQDPVTFTGSKLDWSELDIGRHARILALYRALARLRHEYPDLTDPRFSSVHCLVDEERRLLRMQRGSLELVVNFSAQELTVPAGPAREVLSATVSGAEVGDQIRLPAHAGVLLGPDRVAGRTQGLKPQHQASETRSP